jgi:hypothetical protein
MLMILTWYWTWSADWVHRNHQHDEQKIDTIKIPTQLTQPLHQNGGVSSPPTTTPATPLAPAAAAAVAVADEHHRYWRSIEAFNESIKATTFNKHTANGKSKGLASPLSSPRSGAPIAKDDIRLLTERPASSISATEVGRIPLPHIIQLSSYKRSNEATKTREEWLRISSEEAVAMLLDPTSSIGESDVSNWSDEQLQKLVEIIEPNQWPIMIKKSNTFGEYHNNGVDITWYVVVLHRFCNHHVISPPPSDSHVITSIHSLFQSFIIVSSQ